MFLVVPLTASALGAANPLGTSVRAFGEPGGSAGTPAAPGRTLTCPASGDGDGHSRAVTRG